MVAVSAAVLSMPLAESADVPVRTDPSFRGRLLFVPVSAPQGMGEYARALTIATAAAARWPNVAVHFALSRAAPYSADVPFPATLLPSSPTFHTREVAALIRDFRPDVVLFDNAGRTAQLRAAREHGARVVYVSSRPRQRRKAFRLQWMDLVHEHWIAYPQLIAGALSPLERLKLRLLERPVVRYVDVVLPEPDAALGAALLSRFAVRAGSYVLAVPGGGVGHPGAQEGPAVIAQAAQRLAARGHPTILVGVTPANSARSGTAALQVSPRLPAAQLAELMRNAQLVLANGGDTLLQALACRRPCVAAPIAGDQHHRIRRCVEVGLVVGARLHTAALERACLELLGDPARQSALARRSAEERIANGLEGVLEAIHVLGRARSLAR